MSNYAVTTKMNIYIPMREDIINKWGSMNNIIEEAKTQGNKNYAKEFTSKFLEAILKKILTTKSISYLPLMYGLNEDANDEFRILVVISFETTYSNVFLSNDKLVEMETFKFYEKLINILERHECEYSIYDSVLV